MTRGGSVPLEIVGSNTAGLLPEEHEAQWKRQDFIWLVQGSIEYAEKTGKAQGEMKGREEGEAKGLEQGLEQGREQGLEQGRELGREEERLQDARKMKQAGVATEIIVQVTGLSRERVDAL